MPKNKMNDIGKLLK